MRPPRLHLTHPEATRARLLGVAKTIPGARLGLKIAALLLLLEGQRPGWIVEVLGLTRMSLTRWIHGVNGAGLAALVPKPRPGRRASPPRSGAPWHATWPKPRRPLGSPGSSGTAPPWRFTSGATSASPCRSGRPSCGSTSSGTG